MSKSIPETGFNLFSSNLLLKDLKTLQIQVKNIFMVCHFVHVSVSLNKYSDCFILHLIYMHSNRICVYKHICNVMCCSVL